MISTSRVYEIIERTDLTHAVNLSNRLECKISLKREDLLPNFSFKLRGAYNKMSHLDPDSRWKGVIACSAGEKIFFDLTVSTDNLLETQGTMLREWCTRPRS